MLPAIKESFYSLPLALGSQFSIPVTNCQVCGSGLLDTVLFLGYMPPVNQMRSIGSTPHEQSSYPASLLHCRHCDLVQIGLVVDPQILFPPAYPYTSGTTKILHDNFDDLAQESISFLNLNSKDLVVDIGSNDGTLLSKFQKRGMKVLGIEPTDVGKIAQANNIETIISYFGKDSADRAVQEYGHAKVVTAANVFAHIENIHDIIKNIKKVIGEKGVFISESHYLISLLETVQYDTIYHEHLRYYSLNSLKYLLSQHDLEIIKVTKIPTHGGSIRVYAAYKGQYSVHESVQETLGQEPKGEELSHALTEFKKRVLNSKLQLLAKLNDIKTQGKTICAVSAPSRASTLVNYVGIDEGMVDLVAEIEGSLKIGKYMPGTIIPVVNQEDVLFGDIQPDYALILSWHIASELVEKLKGKGFKGKFIVPLPEPHIIG